MIYFAHNVYNNSMIEREKTFLAKYIPQDVFTCESKDIIDIYIPKNQTHPHLRVRKSGDEYEITKKVQVEKDDASTQKEFTIPVTKEEYDALSGLPGKQVEKRRYYYLHNGKTIEFDIFLNDLSGLVLIDVEFSSEEEKAQFIMPDFCLVDITQEEFIAGGVLCGKTYKDISAQLQAFGYNSIK